MTRLPLAHILAWEPHPTMPGMTSAAVLCPFCGGVHHHGLGPDGIPDEDEVRVSHCQAGDRYLIVKETR